MPSKKQVARHASGLRKIAGARPAGVFHVAAGRDITGRTQTQEALRRSETKFRTLYDATSDAVMLLDEKGFFDCNPATLTIFGCATKEEYCSKHPADVSPPTQPDGTDSRTLANQQIAIAMEKGRNHFEWMHKRADTGEVFPADVVLTAMELDGKRVLCATVRDLTERKQAEEAVIKSHAMQRAIFDSTADFIWAVDVHGFGLLTFNRAFRDYSLQQRGKRLQVGQRPEDLVPNAEYVERWQGFFQRVLASGPFTTEYLAASGKVMLLLTFYLLNHDKAVFGISVFGKDITERKRTEEALRRSETKFRTLYDATSDAVMLLGEKGFFDCNPATLAIFGCATREEFCSKHPADVSPPTQPDGTDSRTLANQQIAIARAKGRNHFEWMHKRADTGQVFPADVLLTAMELDGKRVLCATVRDVSERRRLEDQISRISKQRQAILDVSPIGISLNKGRIIEWANPAHCAMFGYTLEEIQGMDTSALFTREEDYKRVVREIALRIPQGLICTVENEFQRKNGTRFWCFAQGRALDPNDLSVGVIWMLMDITERKQVEKIMRMFSHEIVTAQENERRRLSTILHHDVGSLAVGISAHLDAIEEDLRSGQPGKALRWLQPTRNLVAESLKRLKRLAVELRPPELDVLGPGAALRQHFSLVAKRGGIRIRFRERQHGNRLIGDTAIVLFRVAQEALTNAITHGLARRVAVDLLTVKKEARLTIRDNGRGFDPSEQTKLPLSHLGLRVMREMAEFVGDAFTVDSSPSKGTTVCLTLPIKTAPAAPPLRRGRGLELTGAAARQKTTPHGSNIPSPLPSSRPRKGSRA